MISLKNITKSFGGFVAVKNLSIEITEGEIYGLLGSNGVLAVNHLLSIFL